MRVFFVVQQWLCCLFRNERCLSIKLTKVTFSSFFGIFFFFFGHRLIIIIITIMFDSIVLLTKDRTTRKVRTVVRAIESVVFFCFFFCTQIVRAKFNENLIRRSYAKIVRIDGRANTLDCSTAFRSVGVRMPGGFQPERWGAQTTF